MNATNSTITTITTAIAVMPPSIIFVSSPAGSTPLEVSPIPLLLPKAGSSFFLYLF